MTNALIDMAVIEREVDTLVDGIELDGWVVERPGHRTSADRTRVIRYLGMQVKQNPDGMGRAGSSHVMLSLRFVVGSTTALGDLTWLSTHHSGAGVSAVLSAMVDASFDADGHRGGFDSFEIQDTELDPTVFAVERVVTVHGDAQRASGRSMITIS